MLLLAKGTHRFIYVVMASISDIVQQYTEMRQGLKQLGLELETYWPNPNEHPPQKVEIADDTQGTDEKSADLEPKSKEESIASTRNSVDVNANDKADDSKDPVETSGLDSGEKNEPDTNEKVDASDNNDDDNNEQSPKIDSGFGKASNISIAEDDDEEEEKQIHVSLDRFQQVMEDYRRSANNRFEELEALYINVDAKWKDVMIYYGENPKIMRPHEFFNIFSQFLHSWKITSIEEFEYTTRLEREERRKMELEEKRNAAAKKTNMGNQDEDNPAVSTISDNVDNDRRVMDTLMEQLRSGKIENKTRQRRRIKEMKLIKNTAEQSRKSIIERRNVKPLSVKLERRNSVSSINSFDQMPAISAEELLNSLMQEED